MHKKRVIKAIVGLLILFSVTQIDSSDLSTHILEVAQVDIKSHGGAALVSTIDDIAIETTDVIDILTTYNHERLALVIGNENYDVDPLLHPVEDARTVRNFLVSKGFTVIYAENATMRVMSEKIAEFMKSVKQDSVALIYYSGHGVQEQSEKQHGELTNYLIPINNIRLKDISDLDYDSISLNKLLLDAPVFEDSISYNTLNNKKIHVTC